MKISFEKNSLMQSISIVLKAVPSKTTLPILECIHIDATTDVVKFTTNDMELGIKTVAAFVLTVERVAVFSGPHVFTTYVYVAF